MQMVIACYRSLGVLAGISRVVHWHSPSQRVENKYECRVTSGQHHSKKMTLATSDSNKAITVLAATNTAGSPRPTTVLSVAVRKLICAGVGVGVGDGRGSGERGGGGGGESGMGKGYAGKAGGGGDGRGEGGGGGGGGSGRWRAMP